MERKLYSCSMDIASLVLVSKRCIFFTKFVFGQFVKQKIIYAYKQIFILFFTISYRYFSRIHKFIYILYTLIIYSNNNIKQQELANNINVNIVCTLMLIILC